MFHELTGQFGTISAENVERASKYVVLTGHDSTDYQSIIMLELIRQNVILGTSGDTVKYNIPESYRTELTWTINLRSLQNFLTLRTDKAAHFEIRHLANLIYEALPDEAKTLVKHCLYTESTQS